MKTPILVAVLIAAGASATAFAGASCQAHPKDKWIKEADFKKQLTGQGYQIKTFKVDGNCYELYGKNKDGKKVEIYFDTVSGKPVKSEIDD
ncbi:hypothetical protein EV683_11736 [Crenobacter luteus]|uniref:PepSY domain-containing protein n=1 Tax=Crenobacter luteus TaxID=1452487 RepID=A0A163CY51_9NEIS|nr:PepSY domain-containing protein [Crenobacter luteus]KZE33456.1 hypothetical protein AVW16_07890 [Crenobacter luteus]TCP10916.1 hypothetical protein EV683_11736 [Crenobacter luteus]